MIDSSVDYKNLPRPTWAEIDIDAILNNINEYKKALGNKVEIIVAAKGNGYGHGMLPIVKAINELDIYGFATGNMYEAIEMRKHGIDKPIQLFAHNFPETADLLVKYDLMPSFVKPGDAKSFADALGKDVALKVWVKCDTGLGRLGLLPEEVLPELEYIRNETSFKIEGLYSHIGPTDSDKNPKKDEYNEGQISCFIPYMLKNILEYINSNYQNSSLTLSSIAERFWVNPSYLSRYFKTYMGINIVQYIRSMRIFYAKSLLQSSDMSIAEVAEKVGVKSASHFSKIFENEVGESPSKFRKSYFDRNHS